MMKLSISEPRWSFEDMAYDRIDRSLIVGEQDWFYLVAASSFVEILSDLYARNLGEYYAGDDEACAWLSQKWEPEEMQHGRALRQYVETVWPAFDWHQGFEGFRADYSPYCQTNLLGPTRTLEMAARCVVETGTSSFYAMIRDASPEPVLACIAGHIHDDEIGHYKGFYHFFKDYQTRERASRWQIGREIWRRVAEVDSEDAFLAVRNVALVHNPGRGFTREDFQIFRHRIRGWMRLHYPFPSAAKMLLKPLALPASVQKWAVPLLVRGVRRLV